jgi:hypothetical protein
LWLIAEDCHELLDAIPVLVADPDRDGDIIKTDSLADDIADTARYGIKSMLALHPKPKEVERREMLESFDEEIDFIRKLRGTVSGNDDTES